MSRKHFFKYFQNYYLFFSSATVLGTAVACSTTKKVPDGEYLLTKNSFTYQDSKIFQDELPNYVSQKPNKKSLFFLPIGLWMYNAANPKYDSILNEYMTYPSEMRNQKLRDSLFVKAGHPEYQGKSLFTDRLLHNWGSAPVLLDQEKTKTSANSIRKRLVYRGFWDADVKFDHKLDSANKKAAVNYLITHKDPTIISDYYYNIPDQNIKKIYEEDLTKSVIRSKKRLDQTDLEAEIKRLSELMRSRGYYKFNIENQDIYFTADTLTSRKLVPLMMDIHKDSVDSPYKVATIGNVDVGVVENMQDFKNHTEKDSLRKLNFHKIDNQFKTKFLWRTITLEPGKVYDQKELDLTKRNILATNNFSMLKARDSLRNNGVPAPNDSIVDVVYLLKPLPKYELKLGTDINYSQLLNLGVSPSVDLTSRNLFGGMENLNTTLSGTFGSIKNPKDLDKRVLAYEIAAQATLNFPRLLLPFTYYKIIPKRYSPTSQILLGASVQNNIGLGRINLNTSLNYTATVNDVISHRLSLFNTQLSITKNKDKYYDFFVADREYRDYIYDLYFSTNPQLASDYNSGLISEDDVSRTIVQDQNFQNSLNSDQQYSYNGFMQSLVNKDRQTQNVLISSFIYNFIYNEIGKKEYHNPIFFNGKIESSGNLINLFTKKTYDEGVFTNGQKTIYNVPVSQFVKFDLDFRKYFTFFDDKHTLAFRQFIGLGIPLGSTKQMPFIRSYYNGGANDIRAWTAFGGLGPSDSQLDERIRTYMMDNVKLTTSVEYRVPLTKMYEVAAFADAGNIWSFKDNGIGDQFKFSKFISQMGVGTGAGLRINVAYITIRLDAAWKLYNPNKPLGERFVLFNTWKPTLNLAFGYPF